MTNDASIDYADVVEQLAERQWRRMTRTTTAYAALNPDDQRAVRAQVEPILADLLDLHGDRYETRALCEPAPEVFHTLTIRLDRGTSPKVRDPAVFDLLDTTSDHPR